LLQYVPSILGAPDTLATGPLPAVALELLLAQLAVASAAAVWIQRAVDERNFERDMLLS